MGRIILVSLGGKNKALVPRAWDKHRFVCLFVGHEKGGEFAASVAATTAVVAVTVAVRSSRCRSIRDTYTVFLPFQRLHACKKHLLPLPSYPSP